MNNITDLLDLEDSDIKISDIIIEGQTKTLIIETPPVASYCPICGFRMHSSGVKKSSRRRWLTAVLSQHRTYRSVYGAFNS